MIDLDRRITIEEQDAICIAIYERCDGRELFEWLTYEQYNAIQEYLKGFINDSNKAIYMKCTTPITC